MEQNKSDLTLAKTTYNRILTLYKDSVVTSQRKDEVEAMYKAAVAAERAAYEQYQMAVDGAQKEDKESARQYGECCQKYGGRSFGTIGRRPADST